MGLVLAAVTTVILFNLNWSLWGPVLVIVAGFDRSYAYNYFKSCSTKGSVSNRYNVRNEDSSRHTGLYICREPRRPWSEMWQQMQWFQ